MAINPHELLSQIFPTLPTEEIGRLTELARQRTYPPNTVLCHEGEYEQVLYVICEGEAVVTKRFNDREDLVLRKAGAGEYVGEMAIISDAPRSATVTTTVETITLELDREVFLRILSQSADLALAMVRTTFDRLRANDKM